jgi:hypothetical protein
MLRHRIAPRRVQTCRGRPLRSQESQPRARVVSTNAARIAEERARASRSHGGTTPVVHLPTPRWDDWS